MCSEIEPRLLLAQICKMCDYSELCYLGIILGYKININTYIYICHIKTHLPLVMLPIMVVRGVLPINSMMLPITGRRVGDAPY